MLKILLCLLLSILLLFSFSQNQQYKNRSAYLNSFKTADRIYQLALKQSIAADFDESMVAKADSNFKAALSAFNSVLPTIKKASDDSLVFFINIKTGYINYYFDSVREAKQNYLEAISLKNKLPAIPDSFLFLPCLYTGAIYYRQSQYDSALYFCKKAEQISDTYGQRLAESQRLYNMTGAMYYETGNFRQAKNYFEKAILLTGSSERSMVANYKINLASILIKLDSLNAAEAIYQSLLPSSDYENEIYHNLAIIAIKKFRYGQALSYLRKINYTNDKKSIDLYYNFAAAFSALHENDSAEFYLQRAVAENTRWNGKRKNVQNGLLLKFQADELVKQQFYKEATSSYQAAIQQFITGYNETDAQKNPVEFQGAFSYINLFNTLVAKANAFESWYRQEKNIKLLEGALNTFKTAFSLASYVETSYDSDEARLFLGKIKYNVHSKPINLSLELYDLTRKKAYLEDAYLFDQQNKASTLALNIQQQEFRQEEGNMNPLLKQEASLKSDITRLSLRAMQLIDSAQQALLISAIRDKEIELVKTRDKLNNDPAWKERISSERIPPTDQLQKKLDHNTALLSYHLSENELLIILITESRFEFYKSLINKNFFSTIDNFKTALHNTDGSQKYNAQEIAKNLYEKLIEPVYDKLIEIKRLILIPDDELHYLPFEALQSASNNYLVERFSIQYQYSTALLDRSEKKLNLNTTLSFAPFANGGYEDSLGSSFTALPSSAEEIKGLKGVAFSNNAATKENFLKTVDRYHIIHLATHASVNNREPSKSFIAFYPADNNYRLFATEISNLQLDSAQLVILSACETGAGQLVKGEGLMSLSRAFAYAGCPDIIIYFCKA